MSTANALRQRGPAPAAPGGFARRTPSQQRLHELHGAGRWGGWSLRDLVSSRLSAAVGLLTAQPAAAAHPGRNPAVIVAEAVAASAMDMPLPQEGSQPAAEEASSLRQKLDFRPRLTPLDHLASWAIPALLCAALYCATRPPRLSPLYALGMALVYGVWVALVRVLLLERHWADAMLHETELAEEDSRFATLHGVSVHYKAVGPTAGAAPRAAVHCFHGFGANTASWGPVHARLAAALQASVTTHDMPGFGLTERPRDGGKYSLDFNGRLGREVMDLALGSSQQQSQQSQQQQQQRLLQRPAAGLRPQDSASSIAAQPADAGESSAEGKVGSGPGSPPAGGAASVPRVLMGHSLGAACAAAEAIQNPTAVDALILVAPAVLAPGFFRPAGRGQAGAARFGGPSGSARFSGPPGERPPLKAPARRRAGALRRGVAALRQALLGLASLLVTRLMRPLVIAQLRLAVRSRAFWERGLGRAWYDSAGVTPEVVDAYRQPQLVRGWEMGLLRFTAARISGGKGLAAAVADAWRGDPKPPQALQLAETIAAHGTRVLIVHGEDDGLVPASNSARLAQLLPGARLERMPRAGHVPHEERPDEFLALVQRFLAEL